MGFVLGSTSGVIVYVPPSASSSSAGMESVVHFKRVEAAPQSVMEYGAAGDGTTADNASITTAIAVSPSQVVYFPPGTYQVTGLTLSTAGLILRGAGRSVTKLRLSASASQVLTVSAADVTLEDLTIDGNSNVTAGNQLISCGAKRLAIRRCKLMTAPVGVAVSTGNGVIMDDVEISAVTTAGVAVTDVADVSRMAHVYNTAASTAPMLKFIAGGTTGTKVFGVDQCDWDTSGDSAVLTCQQPVSMTRSTFDKDVQVSPTATFGVCYIDARMNQFTQAGAVGFYDTGVAGTLSTYAGLYEDLDTKAP